MSDRKLFTIGEFKNLCMTTRETLYHYEKLGLLCPTIDESNGYRYYTPYDYYTFMYIAHLTKLGFSLQEVHRYLDNQTVNSYFNAINTSEQRFLAQIDQLMLRNERTRRGYNYVQMTMKKPVDRPQITYYEEEYFLKIPFDNDDPIISDVLCSHEHDRFVIENGADIQRHYHGFYAEDPFSGPTPVFQYSLAKLTDYFECDRLLIRPAGTYISMCYYGPFHADTTNSYRIIREYLETHQFTPMTGMFVDAVISPFYTKDASEYLAQLSIRIE